MAGHPSLKMEGGLWQLSPLLYPPLLPLTPSYRARDQRAFPTRVGEGRKDKEGRRKESVEGSRGKE